jgi:hypothetical protein
VERYPVRVLALCGERQVDGAGVFQAALGPRG